MAVVETVLAIAASIWIATLSNTLAYMAIAASLSPFLLLRSEESAQLGVRWFNLFAPSKVNKVDLSANAWVWLTLLVLSLLIRVIATLCHPFKGIQSIPKNWVRAVLCSDLATPVELVPGTGSVREVLQKYSYEDLDVDAVFMIVMFAIFLSLGAAVKFFETLLPNSLLSAVSVFFAFVFFFGASLMALGLTCYIVAHMYRFSLKSTALIWLPLVYVVHVAYDKSLTLSGRLEEMQRSALWRLIRFISWVTLALLAAKIVFLPSVINWWNQQVWTRVINVYVMPNQIHGWHIAAGLNSVIALVGYYYFIDRAPLRIRDGSWNESQVMKGLEIFSVTVVLSLFIRSS